MKKFFLIVSLFQLNSALCMEKKHEKKKAILGFTALSPKTARAVFATLREEQWNVYAPQTMQDLIQGREHLKNFVIEQCKLQHTFKKKNVEADAQEYGFKVNSWQITYEEQEVSREKFSRWLNTQLKNTDFFNVIPEKARQKYINHVIEEYRKTEPPSDDDDNGIKLEKIQEHYEVRINQSNLPSLRRSSD